MRTVFRQISRGLLSLFLLGNTGGFLQAKGAFVPYVIDTSHSRVGFEIAHLMISTVEGSFKNFSGTFEYDAATNSLENSDITIQVDSIDTNEPKRDEHLKSPDFFDAKKFPTITFTHAKLEAKEGKPVLLQGTFQMHGVSKPVALRVDFKGFIKDPSGTNHMVFLLEGVLNRKDFGLTWNKTLDAGGVAMGEEVTIKIRIEATPKEASQKK
jgi:polyisoprenoid-binding protein YceI